MAAKYTFVMASDMFILGVFLQVRCIGGLTGLATERGVYVCAVVVHECGEESLKLAVGTATNTSESSICKYVMYIL